MDLTLKVWRQDGPGKPGEFKEYEAKGISPESSFLEMLDFVNERLVEAGEVPIEFDHDCREGICGMCGVMINGHPHGDQKGTATCQLHMRKFKDGDRIVIEPWRATAMPVVRDLIVDRSALDRIIEAGGYISVDTGGTPDANLIPIPKMAAESSMDAAACIGCGACVAACPSASAMLFVSAKISQFALLPQGRPEAAKRAIGMVRAMDGCGFGNCSNHRECENTCPKEISIVNIARLNREFLKASFVSEE